MVFWRRHKTVLGFLVLWGLYLALEALRGRLANPSALISGLLVLLFFLLLGIVLSAAAQSWQRSPAWPGLFACAIGLAALDQIIKIAVNALLPEGGRIPLLEPWIALGHERNQANSWLLDLLEVSDLNRVWLIIFSLTMLGLIFFLYHFYVTQKRGGFWPVAAFVLLSAGVASALIDQSFWRFTLDFIALTGLVTADLKDIYLILGVGCVLAEAVSNPATRWGFHPCDDLRELRAYLRGRRRPPRG